LAPTCSRDEGVFILFQIVCDAIFLARTLLISLLIVVRNRLWNSTGFFFIAWAFHYFPFFLMNRQLFLHHYLPAHLCSALVAGSIFNFIAGESINFPVSFPGPGMRRMPVARSDVGMKAMIAAGIYMIPFFGMFFFLSPLTYGTPGYVSSYLSIWLLFTDF
jgi:dolichyl-phosphate-mannose-protein mannosyltransferase